MRRSTFLRLLPGAADIERFDRYVDRCLYGDGGFYAARGRAGRAGGDFVTSPEVGPLFGAVLARALDAWWRDLGSPDRFTVVEAGAGRGALAASVLAASPRCLEALDYVTVERSDALRSRQRELLGDRVTVASSLDEVASGAPIVGVIVANELLDNLAFRLVVKAEQGWSECFVDSDGPVLVPCDPPGIVRDLDVGVGVRLPVQDAASDWVAGALGRLEAGRLVAFDYGVATTPELVGRTWLRTYREHSRGADPFQDPGSADITTDVAFDQLPPATLLRSQAEFLRGWGIEDLVDEGRRVWSERAHIGDLAAVRARSRIVEAEALLDVDGLGGFLVGEWVVG